MYDFIFAFAFVEVLQIESAFQWNNYALRKPNTVGQCNDDEETSATSFAIVTAIIYRFVIEEHISKIIMINFKNFIWSKIEITSLTYSNIGLSTRCYQE